TAEDHVVRVSALDLVVAVRGAEAAADEGRRQRARHPALVAEQDVVTAAALDGVVALAAENDVVEVAARQRVVAQAAGNARAGAVAGRRAAHVLDAIIAYAAVELAGDGGIVEAVQLDHV